MKPKLHFEDFVPGSSATYGALTVERAEIIAFAAQYDPQPMHLDEAAGAKSLLGGLAASGWQSCAFLMRMIADEFIADAAGMGAPGVDELKWLKPVRPGDVLSVRHTVLEARESKSKADRGFVKFRFEMLNQRGEVVMEQINSIIFARRGSAA
jgi:acyl dehydratase